MNASMHHTADAGNGDAANSRRRIAAALPGLTSSQLETVGTVVVGLARGLVRAVEVEHLTPADAAALVRSRALA